MTTQTLSPLAQQVAEQYLHFPLREGVTFPIPYFNNKRVQVRAGLRVMIGKGSVREIKEELEIICLKHKKQISTITSDEARALLIADGIGIDCSGFAYYVLDAQIRATSQSTLASRITFPHTWNPLRRLIRRWRVIENINVETFADDRNSTAISLRDVAPGDYITIIDAGYTGAIDHIMIVEAVDRAEDLPICIHLIHAFAWSSEGQTDHGVRRGLIHITDISKPLLEQTWEEKGKKEKDNETYKRATEAKRVEIRRITK